MNIELTEEEKQEAKETGRAFFNDQLFHRMQSVENQTHVENNREIEECQFIVEMIRSGIDFRSLSEEECRLLQKYYGPHYLRVICQQIKEDRELLQHKYELQEEKNIGEFKSASDDGKYETL